MCRWSCWPKSLKQKKVESTKSSRAGDNDLQDVKLTDRDDIEAYLTTFERLMAAYNIPQNKWIFKLAPQLTGKAQQDYAALTTEDALIYDAVKAAILRHYYITEETYCQHFQSAVRCNEETHRDLAIWALNQEQLFNTLTPAVQVWVKKQKPNPTQLW